MGGAAGGKAGAGAGGVDLAIGGMFDFGAGDDGGFGLGMGPLLDGEEYFTVGSQGAAGRASQGMASAARRRGVDLLDDERSRSERAETEDEDGADSRGTCPALLLLLLLQAVPLLFFLPAFIRDMSASRVCLLFPSPPPACFLFVRAGRLNKSSAGRSSVSDVELLRRGTGAASVDGSLASGASAVRRGIGLDGSGGLGLGLDDDRGSVYSSDTGGDASLRGRERAARRATRASLAGAEFEGLGLGLGGAGAGAGGASEAELAQMNALMAGQGMGMGVDDDFGLGGLGGLDGNFGGDAGAGVGGLDGGGVDQGGDFDVYRDAGNDGYGDVEGDANADAAVGAGPGSGARGAGAAGAGSSPADAADAEMVAAAEGIDATAGAFAATDADVAAARAADEERRKAAKAAREAEKAARAAARKEKREAQLREASEQAGAAGASSSGSVEDTQLVLTGDQIRSWLGDTTAITKPAIDKKDHAAVAAWSRRLAAPAAAGAAAKSRAWLDSVLAAPGGSGAFDADIAAAVNSGGAFSGLFSQQAAAAPPVKAVGGAALMPADAALLAATSAMHALTLVPKEAPAAAGMRALLNASTAAIDARLTAPAGSLLSLNPILPGIGLSCGGPELAALSAAHLAGRTAFPQMPAEEPEAAASGAGAAGGEADEDADEEAIGAAAGAGAAATAATSGKAGKASASRARDEYEYRDADDGAGYGDADGLGLGLGEDGLGVDQGGDFDVDVGRGGDLALEPEQEDAGAGAGAGAGFDDAALGGYGLDAASGAGGFGDEGDFGLGLGLGLGLTAPSPAPSAGGASQVSSTASSASKLRAMSSLFNPAMALGAEGPAAAADVASGSAPGSAARGAAAKGTPSSAASDAGSSAGAGAGSTTPAAANGDFTLAGRWHQQTKAMLQILASEMTGPLTKEAAAAAAAAVKTGRKRKAGEMDGGADAAGAAALGPEQYDLSDVTEGRGTADDPVSFLSLAEGADRRQVALSFFQLLQLKTWSIVDVSQEAAYGEIGVTRTERFAKALTEVNRGMH